MTEGHRPDEPGAQPPAAPEPVTQETAGQEAAAQEVPWWSRPSGEAWDTPPSADSEPTSVTDRTIWSTP
ncbi:MAG: hypothetical protein ACXV2I_13955 [Actinomycetes bacterium]